MSDNADLTHPERQQEAEKIVYFLDYQCTGLLTIQEVEFIESIGRTVSESQLSKLQAIKAKYL